MLEFILTFVVLIVVAIVSNVIGWHSGYDDGKRDGWEAHKEMMAHRKRIRESEQRPHPRRDGAHGTARIRSINYQIGSVPDQAEGAEF